MAGISEGVKPHPHLALIQVHNISQSCKMVGHTISRFFLLNHLFSIKILYVFHMRKTIFIFE